MTMNLYVQLPPLKKMKKTDQTIPGVSHSFEDLYTYNFDTCPEDERIYTGNMT